MENPRLAAVLHLPGFGQLGHGLLIIVELDEAFIDQPEDGNQIAVRRRERMEQLVLGHDHAYAHIRGHRGNRRRLAAQGQQERKEEQKYASAAFSLQYRF